MSSPQKKPVPGLFGPPGGLAFQQMQLERMDQDSDEEDQQYKEVSQRLQLQGAQLNSLKNTLDTVTAQLQNQQQQFNMLAELQTTVANLVQHLQEQQPLQQVPPDPSKPLEPMVIQIGLNKGIIKELFKKVYSFPKLYKLQGPENFDQWKQALTIIFRALGIVQFITDPNIGDTLFDINQAVLLIFLRDSYAIGPQAVLIWQTTSAATYKFFIQQYSHSLKLLRDSLSWQYQALNFNGYKGSLTDFNTTFNNVVAHLTFSRFNIDFIDKVNQYLKSLEMVYPLWVKRQRSSFRTMKAIKTSIIILNLKFLIADILKEQRNPTSTTSKRTFVHRANRPFKDPTRQNKGSKRTESSRPPNRRKRPDRGSNHNTHPEDDEEASKNAETELESDLDPELKSFTYIIRNFDLDNSKSNCSIGSTNSKDNAKNSEIEGGYLAAFNKSKRLLKRSPNRPDLLLYDTG